jgi:DNA polymerase V
MPKKEVDFLEDIVLASFPSPAENYVSKRCDIGDFLVPRPEATFFLRCGGLSMVDAGVLPDDILVVDKSLIPKKNSTVIAVIAGNMTIKRLVCEREQWVLLSENKKQPLVRIAVNEDVTIWGVVTYVIHKT